MRGKKAFIDVSSLTFISHHYYPHPNTRTEKGEGNDRVVRDAFPSCLRDREEVMHEGKG